MTKITLITGSTLGNAEYVAEYLADKLEEYGLSTEIFHGPNLNELANHGLWLVVSSTHGAGQLPDNLSPLLEQLHQQQPNLSQIKFGAVGLGNSEYDLFCGAIKQIDAVLTTLGAQRIGDRIEIDVTQYDIPEDPAEIWLKNWIHLIQIEKK